MRLVSSIYHTETAVLLCAHSLSLPPSEPIYTCMQTLNPYTLRSISSESWQMTTMLKKCDQVGLQKRPCAKLTQI